MEPDGHIHDGPAIVDPARHHMRTRTRLVIAAGLVVLVPGVLLLVWLMSVKASHPRDAAGFIEHLDGKVMSRGESVLAPLDDETLIAEGDRACAWLAAQPRALWRTDTEYRIGSLIERYQETPYVGEPLEVANFSTSEVRSMTTLTAWTSLCGATLEFRKPHYIFSSPSD
jgi:hypothetical protein